MEVTSKEQAISVTGGTVLSVKADAVTITFEGETMSEEEQRPEQREQGEAAGALLKSGRIITAWDIQQALKETSGISEAALRLGMSEEKLNALIKPAAEIIERLTETMAAAQTMLKDALRIRGVDPGSTLSELIARCQQTFPDKDLGELGIDMLAEVERLLRSMQIVTGIVPPGARPLTEEESQGLDRELAEAARERQEQTEKGALLGPYESFSPTEEQFDAIAVNLQSTPEALQEATRLGLLQWSRRESDGSIRVSRVLPPMPDPEDLPPAETAPDFPIQTGQEFHEVMSAAADGPNMRNYKTNQQAGTLSHVRPNAPHYTRLSLTPEEIEDGKQIADLERLVKEQNADCCFALLYVSRVLAPPAPLPARAYAGGWIDLDDVAEKIFGKPRDKKEREARRRKAWDFIRFGARASVRGKRTGRVYRDPDTGEEIQTEIDGPLWSFIANERPEQPALWVSEEVPLRIELVVSQDWTRLTTDARTAQYLPMGELLGGIALNKPSGAWARVIGLALANFWRRHPQETLSSNLRPTRRDLLEQYRPKLAPVDEVLKSDHPSRAITYWYQSLGVLVERGYLADTGEAKLRNRPPKPAGYAWQDEWLNEPVNLEPGPMIRPAVETQANALPPTKPKALGMTKRRPGRPKKSRPEGVS